MKSARSFLVALLVVAVLGCNGDVTGLAAECTDDTGTVDVTVSDAAVPVLSWDPACSVAMLLIEEDASDMWGLMSDSEDAAQANQISPPVTYGTVPAGVEAFGPSADLIRGVTYEVILWRVLPAGSTATCIQRNGDGCLMAVHEFVF